MIIRNTTILDFQSLSRRSGVDVLIEGGRVRRIGPDLARTADAPGAAAPADDLIDGSGLYLVPGLVNTHCHTAMTLLRGAAEDCRVEDWFNRHVWRYEQNLTPKDVYIGTLLGAAEMLLSGVTCVADHYFHMDQAWQAYRDSGLRADLAWAVFGVGERWQRQYEQALEFAMEQRGKDPRLTVTLGPHSPYICPEGFLRQVAKTSEELGLKMHIHVSEEKGQLERSLKELGRTPIDVLDAVGALRPGTILAHAYYATNRDLDLIRERQVGVAHCAKTYIKFGDVYDFLPRALRAGVTVGLGTDGPASNNTLSIFEVARDAALLAKSALRNPESARIGDILPLCHRGGEVLGLAGYGKLEEGSLADLVLIDPKTPNMTPEHNVFANLLYSLSERNVHTVIVDGKILVRCGKLLHLDLEELHRNTAQITERLTRTAAGRPMHRY